ncbi:hypothetical protein [Moritella viscosa]|uniref:Uncharacterized protein n=1 Tax=Moritella viscosa TaxID=80854 RepID=A0ABY1HAP0_9GAMM|nr:hypothetical protein [Moritella viscosa]SGY84936.1 Putative uncharacterized protein [Moritella viscosa]SGZ19036.1 Putative uncharacterized protein [Moritella viscosa]SHO28497.1 Putative uncharacterized protein [Moritella viscosa]
MNNKTDDLFVQVRTAHRLLAAYYQRLLPTIEQIAHDANTEFYFWAPVRFNKPGRNPFKKWQWDLLPAESTRYVFKHINDEAKVTISDYIVEFIVINDSGINDEQCKGQPDPLNLKVSVDEAQSILRISIYRAITSVDTGFYDRWESGRYPDYSTSVDLELDNGFVKFGFETPLESLMTESGVASIKETIEHYLTKTEQAVLSQQSESER